MSRIVTGVFVGAMLAVLGLAAQDRAPAIPTAQVPSGPPPQFRFAYGLDGEGKIQQVLVYRDDEQIQALDSCTGQDIPRNEGLGELAREDFNFDGYPDLMMRVVSDPQTDNSSYCIWLYDPKSQNLVLSEELSRLTNPQPDRNRQTIVARKNEVCAGRCYVQDTYKWANGHLDPVREESLTEDPLVPPTTACRYVWAVEVEKNGKLVDAGRERVDTGGVMCEPHATW